MSEATLCVSALRVALTSTWCAALCLAAPTPTLAQLAEDAEDAVKRLVVMVNCPEQFGAGFIFGSDADHIYIATATHVVTKCAESRSTRVQFRWSPDPVAADVLKSVGRPLDLAVLGVPRPADFAERGAIAFDRLGDPALLRRGDPVYALGNPRGIRWGMNAAPDNLASIEDDVLLFASTFIGKGHSGGTLLNDRSEIVGMIRGDEPPNGEAVSVSRIIATVREWRYPVRLRPPLPRVVAARDLTCRTKPDGSVGCWGDMDFGQTGGPIIQTLTLPRARFKQIGLGILHLCGLAFDGTVYCRGANRNGQLGTGNQTSSQDDLVAVRQGSLIFSSIAVGGWHTCGLTPQGRAFCWGTGGEGRLGNNSTEDSPVPTPVSGALAFKSLTAGLMNTCGLRQEGDIYCWGGIAGTGIPRESGTDAEIAFVPKRVPSTDRFKLVTSGGGHVCGLTDSGSAYCWGANGAGQLGDKAPREWELQPVPVAGGLKFTSLNAGLGDTTCGITRTGRAYCWGSNVNGGLGTGTKTDSSVPVPVSGQLTFASISVGINHTCAVTSEGELYCWGSEGFGFGTGSERGSTLPILVRNMP